MILIKISNFYDNHENRDMDKCYVTYIIYEF